MRDEENQLEEIKNLPNETALFWQDKETLAD